MKKLKNLIEHIPNSRLDSACDDIIITSIEKDHREVKQGSLFVCIKGFTVDGHEYAEAAYKNGAAAILAERELDLEAPVITVKNTSHVLPIIANAFFDSPTEQFPLIGVTGTNGKTSVTHLIDEMFKAARQKTGLIGTIEMRINDQVTPVKNTTPDALFLQKSFKQMADERVNAAIMEVSSHALDQGRVHGCNFDIAVFTNLSQDHLDYHPSMDHYLFAKSLLFAQLGNDYNRKKYAIVNIDDPSSEFIIRATSQPVITYGLTDKADFYASNIALNADGVCFELHTPLHDVKINSNLMGLFSVYNMLAATAAAYYCNIELTVIEKVLNNTTGVRGRFQPVANDRGIGVIVDYAHTPDSLENVLQTVQKFCKGKVYVVVGCGGDRDKSKRPQMAKIACQNADKAIFTSDNPRSESPGAIIDDMINELEADNFEVVIDRKEAIRLAINESKKSDVILIAGKGHETYQIIGDQVLEFDDVKVAKQLLED
ncbi:UDP-N-acetylmuramoylalanyl-D-glutamate--2,6-diaminopimelate ligase [Gracilibacillus ureilyticus]|uniref:UDP-N-acetylmuramoyl-L-alanyl-D-glutamate--2,6-diaminopimelate ligase n=1 Tax=Gracilibacillus ureilyticus TaxID=531814 RepID=A0A1H9KXQ7_9BACI|nr:UDP-N-acetylmuramoyl-L-alanyl-D-glutamate--2,6-diaminopimelate ligase [Gracilibacillus ureilyticus]SER03848.1 UDP-N-acetylmuramoylalanyl-D-glutamate--2,6-diaminopimelate ligase [Gracilibacillus ureilyticus]